MAERSASNHPKYSVALPVGVGFLALILLFGGVGLWSVTANLAGAVILRGEIAIDADIQTVQHPDGGVVGDLRVRDGDLVQAGQILLLFDDTFLKSELSLIQRQLAELSARMSRLQAERDGSDKVRFNMELVRLAASDTALRKILDNQQNLFDARKLLLSQQSSQLIEKRGQKHSEIRGTQAQLSALRTQRALMEEEISNLQQLFERGLAPSTRILSLLREKARTEGEIGALEAGIARFRGQLGSINIELLQLTAQSREKAIAALADLTLRYNEIAKQELNTKVRINRTVVRAPVSGVIHRSQVSAKGAVVQPALQMMYVIPQDRPFYAIGRISPDRVDQVVRGQNADLRFTALNSQVTPEVAGFVTSVSADIIAGDTTGASYYRVEIQPVPGEMSKLNAYRMLPGMPVEILIKTGDRTAFSYLAKPVYDYMARAWRA